MKGKGKGWHDESQRHRMSAYGLSTKENFNNKPRYKGQHVHTITKEDIGQMYTKYKSCNECDNSAVIVWSDVLGEVLPLDVGKRVMLIDGIHMVENDEQLKRRLQSSGQKKVKLIDVRKKILDDMGISYDYYPPEQTNDGKARWIYLGDKESKSFKTYPSFERYLESIGDI